MLGKVFETNCSGKVEVIEEKGAKLKVRFLDTGYVRSALRHNLLKGKVKDHTLEYITPTVVLNERHKSNSTGWFTILTKTGKRCVIQFDETGYTTEVYIDNARAGKVKDPYFRTVYGVGYLGEFDKKRYKYWKQAKQLWKNMLKRCYSDVDPKGYKKFGVTVDERWLCFANFLEDLNSLENFDAWLENHGKPTRYNLDKDFKIPGNKVYSRDACMFVEDSLNKSEAAIRNLEKYGPVYGRQTRMGPS